MVTGRRLEQGRNMLRAKGDKYVVDGRSKRRRNDCNSRSPERNRTNCGVRFVLVPATPSIPTTTTPTGL